MSGGSRLARNWQTSNSLYVCKWEKNAGYYCAAFFILELNRSQIKGAAVLSDRLLHASVIPYVHSCYNLQNIHAQMHT
jgi:hypothetical protein